MFRFSGMFSDMWSDVEIFSFMFIVSGIFTLLLSCIIFVFSLFDKNDKDIYKNRIKYFLKQSAIFFIVAIVLLIIF